MNLIEAISLLMATEGRPSENQAEYITVVEHPQYTDNLFGERREIAGKRLMVMERNDQGCCLCLNTKDSGEQHLVDVDVRDIVSG